MIGHRTSRIGFTVSAAIAAFVFVAGCTATPGGTFGGPGGSTASTSSKADRCAAALQYGKASCARIERCGHRRSDGASSVTMERCERGVAAQVVGLMAALGDPDTVSACADTLASAPCGEAGQCEVAMFPTNSQAIVAAGQACKTSSRCEGLLGCVDGTCQERRAEGGACGEKGECKAGLACQAGKCGRVVDGVTSCKSDRAACDDGRPEPTLWGNAQAYGTPGSFFCDDSNVCRKYVRDVPLGGPCGDGGRQCAPQLVCDEEGTKECIEAPPYGASCEGIATCKSCVDLVCLDPINECK